MERLAWLIDENGLFDAALSWEPHHFDKLSASPD